MNKIGILKYPGVSGDHDLYWAVRKCCGQKADFLENGNWNPDEISALLIPGGLFAEGYSELKDLHLVSHVIRNKKPVLTFSEGYYFVKYSLNLTSELVKYPDPFVSVHNEGFQIINNHDWLSGFLPDDTVCWPSSYRFHSFSPDENINSLVTSVQNGRLVGIGINDTRVVSLLIHPERAVDEITGDTTGAKLFTVLRMYL